MIKITRYKENEIGTWGVLEWGSFECFTFEPEGPDTTERGKDRRIPQGEYSLKWHNSARYQKKMPNLYNDKVPLNRHILIHNGNFPNDTEGCILLGRIEEERGVLDSKSVFNEFRNKLLSLNGYEDIETKIKIINDFKG